MKEGTTLNLRRKLPLIFLLLPLLGAPSVRGEDRAGIADKDYDWWRQARFGIFMHWNPSSLLALGAGSWQRPGQPSDSEASTNASVFTEMPACVADPAFEELKAKLYGSVWGKPTMEEYDNLFWRFDPVRFNARKWARFFKESGAGYIVFTTKHHDGFCMWDSAATEYDIMSTPYARDLFGELARACHEEGLGVICYYSVVDWYSKLHDPAHPEAYQKYMLDQVRELATRYHPQGFWWDGNNPCKVPADKVWKIISSNCPGAIANGRGVRLPGVLFGSPEQRLGSFDRSTPWESCVTMAGESWFWNGGRNMMRPSSCVRLLVNAATGDGNLLLDFGPTEQGTIPEQAVKNYAAIGKWLKAYGESIKGTRGGPYKPSLWGGSTCSGRNVYLHIQQEGPAREIRLAPLPAKIVSYRVLTGGRARLFQRSDALVVRLDEKAAASRPETIVRLTLNRKALDIAPLESMQPRFQSLNAMASASSTFSKSHPAGSVTLRDFELNRAKTTYYGEEPAGNIEPDHNFKPTPEQKEKYPWIDHRRDHIWRYWMADPSDSKPWIELDLEAPRTFNYVTLMEKFDRTDAYRLQYRDAAGHWKDLYRGRGMGNATIALKAPVTARKVRVVFDKWTTGNHPGEEGGPGLRQFDIWFLPGK